MYTSAYYLNSYILFQVYLATLMHMEATNRLPKLTNPVTLPLALFSSIMPFFMCDNYNHTQY